MFSDDFRASGSVDVDNLCTELDSLITYCRLSDSSCNIFNIENSSNAINDLFKVQFDNVIFGLEFRTNSKSKEKFIQCDLLIDFARESEDNKNSYNSTILTLTERKMLEKKGIIKFSKYHYTARDIQSASRLVKNVKEIIMQEIQLS